MNREQLEHEIRRMWQLQLEYLSAGKDYRLGVSDAVMEEVILLGEIEKCDSV